MKLKILLLEDIPTDTDIIVVKTRIKVISESFNNKHGAIPNERVDLPLLKKGKPLIEVEATITLSKIKGGYLFAAIQKGLVECKKMDKALNKLGPEVEVLIVQKDAISEELKSKDKEITLLRNEVERTRLHKVLSKREFEVLCMIATGQSIKEIAKQLFLSPATIATYRARLLDKLNLKSTIDLVLYAIRSGLIE